MVDVKCGICHKVFPSTSRKNQHQKSCGGVNCSICNRKFTSKRVMQEHYNSQHTVLFRCAQCGKCFGGLSKLNRHKTVHNETNTCECGKSFSRIDNLNKHKKTHAEQQQIHKLIFFIEEISYFEKITLNDTILTITLLFLRSTRLWIQNDGGS